MSDADGDSTMHSSPSLPSDNEMFPDEALPQTPAAAALLSTEDLSPPNSQPHPASTTALGVNANGKRPLSLAHGGAPNTSNSNAGSAGGNSVSGSSTLGSGALHHDAETGYAWTKQEDQPGYEWKNTRAREEESRALDAIVDKSLQVKTRYGDPLDASVPAKAKR
ncbi:hypothetical protein ACN47E_005168 [Coniothyrium glycines]